MNPKTDWVAWKFWFDTGQYIVTILVGFFVWICSRNKARSKDIKAVKESTSEEITDIKKSTSKEINEIKDTNSEGIKAVEIRVTKLETSAITHKDLGEVYERINEVSDKMSELAGTTKGIKGSVDMIQDHLLNNGG